MLAVFLLLLLLFLLDVFEAFVRAVDKLGLRDHPGAKVVITVGGLLTDAACELKLDGMWMGYFFYYTDSFSVMQYRNTSSCRLLTVGCACKFTPHRGKRGLN